MDGSAAQASSAPEGQGAGAGHAPHARVPVDPVFPRREGVRARGTDALAGAAADAQGFIIEKLGQGGLGFRVMAPHAAQGAALQKNRRAQTGAVVGAKPLDLGHGKAVFSHGRHPLRGPAPCAR